MSLLDAAGMPEWLVNVMTVLILIALWGLSLVAVGVTLGMVWRVFRWVSFDDEMTTTAEALLAVARAIDHLAGVIGTLAPPWGWYASVLNAIRHESSDGE